MHTRTLTSVVAAVAAAVLALSACSSGNGGAGADRTSGSGGLTKVSIAIPSNSAAADFIQLAVAAGLTKKHGLDVTLNTSIPAANTPAALQSGGVQVASVVSTVTQAHAKGLPVVNVVNTSTHAPLVLVAGPGISSVSDLAGKSVATSVNTDVLRTETNEILAAGGVAGKVKLIAITTAPARSALFHSGHADAEYAPINLAIDDMKTRPGSKIIADNLQTPPTPANGLGVTEDYLRGHPQTVLALVKASMEATNMMKNEPAKALPYLEQIYHLDKAGARQLLDNQKDALVINGQPTPDCYRNQADVFAGQPQRGGGPSIDWTADKVAASWNLTAAKKAAAELGYTG